MFVEKSIEKVEISKYLKRKKKNDRDGHGKNTRLQWTRKEKIFLKDCKTKYGEPRRKEKLL